MELRSLFSNREKLVRRHPCTPEEMKKNLSELHNSVKNWINKMSIPSLHNDTLQATIKNVLQHLDCLQCPDRLDMCEQTKSMREGKQSFPCGGA